MKLVWNCVSTGIQYSQVSGRGFPCCMTVYVSSGRGQWVDEASNVARLFMYPVAGGSEWTRLPMLHDCLCIQWPGELSGRGFPCCMTVYVSSDRGSEWTRLPMLHDCLCIQWLGELSGRGFQCCMTVYVSSDRGKLSIKADLYRATRHHWLSQRGVQPSFALPTINYDGHF